MAKSITLLLLAGCSGAGGVLAEAPQHATAAQVPQNPSYSAAVFRNEDPVAYLQGLEARWNAAASPRAGLAVLVHVAKAALEAGDNQKAYYYALQALSIADAVAADRQRRGFKNPRRFEAFCRMVGGDLQQGGYPTSKPRARTLYYGRSQQSCYQAAKEETHNEFADFQRPYCAADEKTLAQLRRRMETG